VIPNKFPRVVKKGNKWRFLYSGISIDNYLKKIKGCTCEEAFNVMCEMAEGGIKIFGDKVPHGYLHNATGLMDEFPDMKFLFTLRDGRGVLESQIRRGKKLLEKKPNHKFNPRSWQQVDIKIAQNLWIECSGLIKNIMNRNSSRVLIVKFEDLLSDTENYLKNVADFLELERPLINRPWMVQNNPLKRRNYYVHPIDQSNAYLWKENIPNVMDEVSDKFKRYLEFFEYI
jgi:hypothetical protein